MSKNPTDYDLKVSFVCGKRLSRISLLRGLRNSTLSNVTNLDVNGIHEWYTLNCCTYVILFV